MMGRRVILSLAWLVAPLHSGLGSPATVHTIKPEYIREYKEGFGQSWLSSRGNWIAYEDAMRDEIRIDRLAEPTDMAVRHSFKLDHVARQVEFSEDELLLGVFHGAESDALHFTILELPTSTSKEFKEKEIKVEENVETFALDAGSSRLAYVTKSEIIVWDLKGDKLVAKMPRNAGSHTIFWIRFRTSDEVIYNDYFNPGLKLYTWNFKNNSDRFTEFPSPFEQKYPEYMYSMAYFMSNRGRISFRNSGRQSIWDTRKNHIYEIPLTSVIEHHFSDDEQWLLAVVRVGLGNAKEASLIDISTRESVARVLSLPPFSALTLSEDGRSIVFTSDSKVGKLDLVKGFVASIDKAKLPTARTAWEDLGKKGKQAEAGYLAESWFSRSDADVTFLRERLQDECSPDMPALIRQLGDDVWTAREAASETLEKFQPVVNDAMVRTLLSTDSAEIAVRARELLSHARRATSTGLRCLRGVRSLQRGRTDRGTALLKERARDKDHLLAPFARTLLPR